jgi:two-component system, NarL family, sensor histidine kinase UhpB
VNAQSANSCAPRLFNALPREVGTADALRGELEALQRRYRLLFEMAPVAICVVDNECIVATNRAFEALVAPADDAPLLGLRLYETLGDDARDALAPLLAAALELPPGKSLVRECRLTLSGVTRVFEIHAAALPDDSPTALQLALTDISKRAAERAELQQSRLELRQLSANVVQAREDARLRIAREMHDELGQRLSALKLDLASLAAHEREPANAERIAAMLGTLDETMTAVRRITADLRPLMLDDLGLNAALEWLTRESARHMGIEITLHLGEADPDLDKDASVAVYRIVQEALTNVARHARATDVRVDLRTSGDELLLMVQDNGIGFPPGATRKAGSFGLLGIRERAALLGGSLVVDNPLVGGARLTVRLPLHRAGSSDAGTTMGEP